MARPGIDAEKIVEMAAQITEEKGLDGVALKEINERLGIRSPSRARRVFGDIAP